MHLCAAVLEDKIVIHYIW